MMKKTNSHMRTSKDQDFLSVTHLQRGNCDEWSALAEKPHIKNWPDPRRTEKDCNDWMDKTCREAVIRVQEFNSLIEVWKKDTMFLSSVSQMAIHPSYLRIIGMGQPALPLILKELRENPSHWFWALEAITGQNPAENAKTFDEGVEDWLNWGRARGHIR